MEELRDQPRPANVVLLFFTRSSWQGDVAADKVSTAAGCFVSGMWSNAKRRRPNCDGTNESVAQLAIRKRQEETDVLAWGLTMGEIANALPLRREGGLS